MAGKLQSALIKIEECFFLVSNHGEITILDNKQKLIRKKKLIKFPFAIFL